MADCQCMNKQKYPEYREVCPYAIATDAANSEALRIRLPIPAALSVEE